MEPTITKQPIGAVGMLHVLKDIGARFQKASTNWPNGVVPTIANTEQVYEHCPQCKGEGFKDGSYVPKGGMAPVWTRVDCETCNATGKIGHPFPKEIVKLAKLLAYQDELTIARTIAGLCLGMRPNE